MPTVSPSLFRPCVAASFSTSIFARPSILSSSPCPSTFAIFWQSSSRALRGLQVPLELSHGMWQVCGHVRLQLLESFERLHLVAYGARPVLRVDQGVIEGRRVDSTSSLLIRMLEVSHCGLPVFQCAHACHALIRDRNQFCQPLSSMLPSFRLPLMYK